MTRAEYEEMMDSIEREERELCDERLCGTQPINEMNIVKEYMYAQNRVLARMIDLLARQIRFDDEPRDGETQEQFQRRVGTKD